MCQNLRGDSAVKRELGAVQELIEDRELLGNLEKRFMLAGMKGVLVGVCIESVIRATRILPGVSKRVRCGDLWRNI